MTVGGQKPLRIFFLNTDSRTKQRYFLDISKIRKIDTRYTSKYIFYIFPMFEKRVLYRYREKHTVCRLLFYGQADRFLLPDSPAYVKEHHVVDRVRRQVAICVLGAWCFKALRMHYPYEKKNKYRNIGEKKLDIDIRMYRYFIFRL